MRLVWLLPLLLLVPLANAADKELWRWVDDQGVVHYSDRPVPGAEMVVIKGAQTYTAPAVAPRAPEPAAGEDGEARAYRRLSVAQPAQEETLWNLEGRLDVQVEVDPAIRGDHEIRVFLDGQRVEDVPPAATAFTLGNVFRGAHTLRVSIVDGAGRELAASDTVRFFVQQTSLLNPNNPNTSPPPRPQPPPRPTPVRPGGG